MYVGRCINSQKQIYVYSYVYVYMYVINMSLISEYLEYIYLYKYIHMSVNVFFQFLKFTINSSKPLKGSLEIPSKYCTFVIHRFVRYWKIQLTWSLPWHSCVGKFNIHTYVPGNFPRVNRATKVTEFTIYAHVHVCVCACTNSSYVVL